MFYTYFQNLVSVPLYKFTFLANIHIFQLTVYYLSIHNINSAYDFSLYINLWKLNYIKITNKNNFFSSNMMSPAGRVSIMYTFKSRDKLKPVSKLAAQNSFCSNHISCIVNYKKNIY